MEWPWIHGPIVIDLSPPTELGTTLPAKFQHVPASQAPLGANQGPTIKRWWNQGPADAPWRRPAPNLPPLTYLMLYKYPHCLSTL
jgi:hypothetical protein